MTAFDQAQTDGDILTIVANLQARLAALELANVTAGTLEEIAGSAGDVDMSAGSSVIDDDGIHSAANLVDVNWWLPMTLAGDVASVIYTSKIRTISGVKYLYVGGQFSVLGGVSVKNIARYNFSTRAWESVGNGLLSNAVFAIAFDSADTLYIGGLFTNAGGDVNANRIAKLSGGVWVNVGAGVNTTVWTIALDSADNLYIGGDFTNAGGDALADYIAKLSGGVWVNVGAGVSNTVKAIAFDSANNLYIGGNFLNAGGDALADYIAKLSGGAWVNVGGGVNSTVYAVALDSADNLYIGGDFLNAGGDALADCIAKLSGGVWVNVESGVNNTVYVIAFDSADNLYIGGGFSDVSAIAEADRIAKWDNVQWSALSNGGGLSGLGGYVYAIAIDNATGNIYAGGDFNTAGTIQCQSLAVYTKPLSDAIDLLGAQFEQYWAAQYAVGDIYLTTSSVAPATRFGYGTWAALAPGRMLIGVGTSDAAYAAGATGGESNHTLTSAEMPVHTHIQNAHNHDHLGRDSSTSGTLDRPMSSSATGTSVAKTGIVSANTAVNQNAGNGGAHNNMPPYLVVYMWQRTA